MAKSRKGTRKNRKPRIDVYEAVTASIIKALEGDVGEWTRPWAVAGLHRSATSGREYRGINQLITMFSAMEQNFGSNLWLTYHQATKLVGEGEKVLKGETGEQKGTRVVFWKFGDKEITVNGKAVLDNKGKPKTEHVLIYATSYTVFNVEQTNVDPAKFAKFAPALAGIERDGTCEAFVQGTGATIVNGGDRAFYSPSADHIGLPARTRFDDTGAYYATAFHELTHWTGSRDRCDRTFGATVI